MKLIEKIFKKRSRIESAISARDIEELKIAGEKEAVIDEFIEFRLECEDFFRPFQSDLRHLDRARRIEVLVNRNAHRKHVCQFHNCKRETRFQGFIPEMLRHPGHVANKYGVVLEYNVVSADGRCIDGYWKELGIEK